MKHWFKPKASRLKEAKRLWLPALGSVLGIGGNYLCKAPRALGRGAKHHYPAGWSAPADLFHPLNRQHHDPTTSQSDAG